MKVPTLYPPSEISQVFYFPSEKTAYFCHTLQKKAQDQRVPTGSQPLRNMSSIGGGVDIKWNGPMSISTEQ